VDVQHIEDKKESRKRKEFDIRNRGKRKIGNTNRRRVRKRREEKRRSGIMVGCAERINSQRSRSLI